MLGIQGVCTSDRPWFNLARQETQPLFQDLAVLQATLKAADGGGDGLDLELTWLEAHVVSDAAFQGGQSLQMTGVS